jgi:hypothetical protein
MSLLADLQEHRAIVRQGIERAGAMPPDAVPVSPASAFIATTNETRGPLGIDDD